MMAVSTCRHPSPHACTSPSTTRLFLVRDYYTGCSAARPVLRSAQQRVLVVPHCSPQPGGSDSTQGKPARYAVLGAGLAGLATAWHLLTENERSQTTAARPVEVHVYDAWGICTGGSGAAAGLLHPYSPKGQLLWNGAAAFEEALHLVNVAEAQSSEPIHLQGTQQAAPSDHHRMPFVWRTGMVRPAANPKQAKGFARLPPLPHHTSNRANNSDSNTDSSSATPGHKQATIPNGIHSITAEHMSALVPNVTVPDFHAQPQPTPAGQEVGSTHTAGAALAQQASRRQRRAAAAAAVPGNSAASPGSLPVGVWIPGGVVLDMHRYLAALWAACQHKAASSLPAGSTAQLHTGLQVQSLAQLRQLGEVSGAGWDAVVVAAGAAVGVLPELRGRLPLQLCQGFTLVLEPTPTSTPYPPDSPSVLGSQYLAAQQEGQCLVVGATKTYGWTPSQTLHGGAPEHRHWDLGGQESGTGVAGGCESGMEVAEEEWQRHRQAAMQAAEQLHQTAAQIWPPAAEWRRREVRSGVRALPPRTSSGSLPLLGRVDWNTDMASSSAAGEQSGCSTGLVGEAHGDGGPCEDPGVPVWVVAGLGSRGLVYHAWLGKQVAQAVVRNDESCVHPELRAWKQLGKGTIVQFDAA